MLRQLTPRQRAILALVAEGLTNQQIAERLYVEEETVHSHLKRAYRRLGLEAGQMNRIQAAVWWARWAA